MYFIEIIQYILEDKVNKLRNSINLFATYLDFQDANSVYSYFQHVLTLIGSTHGR